MSVSEILEEVKTEICDNYCKFSAGVVSDDEFTKMLDERCENCPLMRL